MLHTKNDSPRPGIPSSVPVGCVQLCHALGDDPERVRKHLRGKAADILAMQQLLFEIAEPATVVAVSRGDGTLIERLEAFARDNRKTKRWLMRLKCQLKAHRKEMKVANAMLRRLELKRQAKIAQLKKLLKTGKRIPAALRLIEDQPPLPLAHFPKEYIWVNGRRQQRTSVGDRVTWTEMEVSALHLNLLSYSFEQLRESKPGGELHREIWSWIDRKDSRGIIPFSFDNCCRFAAWDPFYVREAISELREMGGSRFLDKHHRSRRVSILSGPLAARVKRAAA